MFVNFSEEVKHLLKLAEIERENLNHPYIGTEHLFLAVLKEGKLKEVFKKNKITYENFQVKLINLVGKASKKCEFTLYTPLLKKILQNAVMDAREENSKTVNTEIIILSILDSEEGVAYGILQSMKINVEKLYFDIRFKKSNKYRKNKKLLIEELGTNLNKMALLKKLDPVIGRDKEINETIRILLRRKKNNPILIGPAGTGKTAIVEGIANLMVSNNCPEYLKNKRIIALNIFQIVSGTKYRGEFEEKMKNLIKELEENEDIILFIDEVHTIVGAGGAEGAIDASNIFKPALARGNIKVIGATTIDEYKKYIEPDAALSRRFQTVMIKEPNFSSVVDILTKIKPLYEKYHNVIIEDNLIKELVTLTNKYLPNRFEPDKSIDILDESCVLSSSVKSKNEIKIKNYEKKLKKLEKEKLRAIEESDFNKASLIKEKQNNIEKEKLMINNYKKIVTKNDILKVIKKKGNIKILNNDINVYSDLRLKLNKNIIGQEKLIDKLIKTLIKRDIAGNKGVFSILINGYKGSGKTYIANTFLKELIDEKDIIKIDLSEYKESHMISKLIGTTAGYLGYDNKNNIFEKVRINPSSALLIENYEEASNEVKEIFKKILTEGYIYDNSDRKIDFTNSYIVITNEIEENKRLGFSTNNYNEEAYEPIENLVYSTASIDELNDKSKIKLVKNYVSKIISNYKSINVKIDENYFTDVTNKYKSKSIKDNLIGVQKMIEDEIIDNILKNKKEVTIKCNEKINT